MAEHNQTYPCGDCGQTVTAREYHDFISCALYRSRHAGMYSDPTHRDLSILRDEVIRLDPRRSVVIV